MKSRHKRPARRAKRVMQTAYLQPDPRLSGEFRSLADAVKERADV